MNPFEFRGPDFLFFYFVLTALVLYITWAVRRALDGDDVSQAHAASLVSDPYVIAYLRNGANETLRVAAMSLIDRQLLTIEDGGRFKTAPHVQPEHARKKIERAILDAYATGGTIASLTSLQAATGEYDAQLKRLGLLASDRVRARRRLLFVVMLAILGGTGVLKMAIGLSRDRPIAFLFVMTLIGTALLGFIAHPRRTIHGDNFLAGVQRLFGGLRERADTIRAGGATADLALLAAAFGLTVVPTHVAPYRNQLFPVTQSGSSCGSGSSSCSSSSCGGGCGGGGCGGCGS